MFRVGQQVVCVNDAFDPIQQATIPNRPHKYQRYVVRDAFQVTRNATSSGIWALHLKEIKNPMLPHPSGLGQFEPSFAADRFAEMNEDEVRAEQSVDAMLKELVEETQLETV